MISISICLSDLPKQKISEAKNGKKYIELIVAEKKEVDQYGKTHTVFVSQTKDERESQAKTIYVGNGKLLGASKPQAAPQVQQTTIPDPVDDLPF